MPSPPPSGKPLIIVGIIVLVVGSMMLAEGLWNVDGDSDLILPGGAGIVASSALLAVGLKRRHRRKQWDAMHINYPLLTVRSAWIRVSF